MVKNKIISNNIEDDDALKVQTVLDAIQLFHTCHLKNLNTSSTSPVTKEDSTEVKS